MQSLFVFLLLSACMAVALAQYMGGAYGAYGMGAYGMGPYGYAAGYASRPYAAASPSRLYGGMYGYGWGGYGGYSPYWK
ncbi:hypothetical protein AVEN_32640-1 [Araneus ventricosus]|uniref:Uncharacterized protein n=1 Tax=Araneus ventricosus TaxID=182803 RepID=A0A4Y2C8D2_ARAVE|nr:hypothetical protein AVEN_32640-1 [Araneus ventricosus]